MTLDAATIVKINEHLDTFPQRQKHIEDEITSIEDKMLNSHTAIAQTISTIGADMRTLKEDLRKHMEDEDANYKKMTVSVTDKLDKYIESDTEWKNGVNAYMQTMLPVKDGVQFIQLLNKGLKYFGLTGLGAIVSYWLLK